MHCERVNLKHFYLNERLLSAALTLHTAVTHFTSGQGETLASDWPNGVSQIWFGGVPVIRGLITLVKLVLSLYWASNHSNTTDALCHVMVKGTDPHFGTERRLKAEYTQQTVYFSLYYIVSYSIYFKYLSHLV